MFSCFLQSLSGQEDCAAVMARVWNTYIPFVRCYGDTIAVSFNAVPMVDLPKVKIVFVKLQYSMENTKQAKKTDVCLFEHPSRVKMKNIHIQIQTYLIVAICSFIYLLCLIHSCLESSLSRIVWIYNSFCE